MKRLIYSPDALESLEHLKEYLIKNFGDKFADNTLNRLTLEIRDLEVFPEIGAFVRDRYPVDTNYQFFYFRHNYVFYRIEGDFVRIIDIIDERADFMKRLFGVDTISPDTLQYWRE